MPNITANVLPRNTATMETTPTTFCVCGSILFVEIVNLISVNPAGVTMLSALFDGVDPGRHLNPGKIA